MPDADIDQLRAELRERDEFLAFMAHELRNPLHVLGMQLASIRAAVPGETERGQAALGRVKKTQITLARYVERVTLLLDLAQQNVNAFTVRPVNLDLAAVLAQLPARFADDAEFHSTRLRYDGPVSCVFASDAQALDHVVSNLLSNAFKYAAAGEIVVGLRELADGVEISVTDDGRGIAPEQQSSIFEKFQRGRGVPKEGGFGLGLWIVSRLVAALGGRVTLVSREGEGSRFAVTLPLAPVPVADQQMSLPRFS